MRTYLKNWSVVKSATNPSQLVLISDWDLVGKMVRLLRVENIYSNGVITESIVIYDVIIGTPNLSISNAIIPLPVPWYQLPFEHKTFIKSYEATVLKDDESMDTIRTSVI